MAFQHMGSGSDPEFIAGTEGVAELSPQLAHDGVLPKDSVRVIHAPVLHKTCRNAGIIRGFSKKPVGEKTLYLRARLRTR